MQASFHPSPPPPRINNKEILVHRLCTDYKHLISRPENHCFGAQADSQKIKFWQKKSDRGGGCLENTYSEEVYDTVLGKGREQMAVGPARRCMEN